MSGNVEFPTSIIANEYLTIVVVKSPEGGLV